MKTTINKKTSKEVNKLGKIKVISTFTILFLSCFIISHDASAGGPKKYDTITIKPSGRFGCLDESLYKLLVKTAAERGARYFGEYLRKAISINECRMFKKGETFTIIDKGYIRSLIEHKSSGNQYWTSSEVIDE